MRTTKRRRRLSSSWRRKKETMWTSSGQFKSISSRISIIVWWSVRCSTPPLLDRSSVWAPCNQACQFDAVADAPRDFKPLSTLDSVVGADDDFAITTSESGCLGAAQPRSTHQVSANESHAQCGHAQCTYGAAVARAAPWNSALCGAG